MESELKSIKGNEDQGVVMRPRRNVRPTWVENDEIGEERPRLVHNVDEYEIRGIKLRLPDFKGTSDPKSTKHGNKLWTPSLRFTTTMMKSKWYWS